MYQVNLLQQCKQRIKQENFAVQLAKLLNINLDAAYRRIRGTTLMTIDEVALVCGHYKVSFDANIAFHNKMIPFQFNSMFKDKFEIIEYLKGIQNSLNGMALFPNSHMALTAMDIPFFRLFGYNSLSRFKLFFWQKSVLNLEDFKLKKFIADEPAEDFEEIVKQIFYSYHKIKSYEIWAPETLDTTVKQVQYYIESGMFATKNDALSICNDLEAMLSKLERETENGKKTVLSAEATHSSPFELYQSDMFLSNNCIQAHVNENVYTYITFNTFNHLMTYIPEFSLECEKWMQQVKSKSVLLSEVSEKLRFQFFQQLKKKVHQLKLYIEES